MATTRKQVSAKELCNLFNQGDYHAKVERGELTATLQKSKHPSPPKAFLPHCSRSQIVVYADDKGRKIAIVHQYLKPDGKLGASGKPDPKMLFHEGVVYTLQH